MLFHIFFSLDISLVCCAYIVCLCRYGSILLVMASFSRIWICHWFIMISFGSIVLLLYYWILLVDCGQWLRRLICSSVFCYGYITGSWWTMLGCCYADTHGCSWCHHLCKTHGTSKHITLGEHVFHYKRVFLVYFWLFFFLRQKNIKKSLGDIKLPWTGYFSASLTWPY